MKKTLELSIMVLPWLMIILVGMTVLTMMVILYQKRQNHHKLNRKE
jgi:hypothetical protein